MEWKILLYARRKEPLDIPDDLSKYPMNDFELDYWRIVNSAPFRRLQDKTQVFPLDKSDFVRTRLTHSMETSALAKQLATMITANIRKNKSGTPYAMTEDEARDAVNAVMCAGLLHDIGNPPPFVCQFGCTGQRGRRFGGRAVVLLCTFVRDINRPPLRAGVPRLLCGRLLGLRRGKPLRPHVYLR